MLAKHLIVSIIGNFLKFLLIENALLISSNCQSIGIKNNVFVSNGMELLLIHFLYVMVKQGGILSPKLFNVYVDVRSQQLNKVMVGCCMNSKVINHLYYANDLVLLSPSAHGMQKLLSECENMHQNTEWNLTEIRVFCLTLKDINSKLNLQPRCILMVSLWKRRHRTSSWVTLLIII